MLYARLLHILQFLCYNGTIKEQLVNHKYLFKSQ